MIRFVKTHALGNDFILVAQNPAVAACSVGQDPAVAADYSELARRICNRYFGIGGDGLILWQSAADSFNLRIFNRDGSEAECSGNGLRCVAAYLIEAGQWPKNEIRLKTISGLYTLRRSGQQYEADMGQPLLKPDAIPFIPPLPIEKVVDYPLRANGRVFAITACSTGNPHCSLFVDELDDSYIETVGPLLETHSAFPRRTNVEFIHVLDDREIEVAFWERGVGRTYASGTGSCGATVASILNGKTGRQVLVHTKAGNLTVEWPENGPLKLTSTANIVAEGNYLEA